LMKEKREGHRVRLHATDLWPSDLLKGYASARQPDTVVGPDDPAVILMSGGTTGIPKGALGRRGRFTMRPLPRPSITRAA